MFGKLMNNFYYGKSGKGDFRKEDLPRNRWQLFWEMLRIRFSALIRLNLMYMVVWLPAMIVLMMGAMSLVTGLSSMVDPEAAEAGSALADMSISDLISGMSTTTLLLLVPCIAITGPFTAGVAFVTRNWARDEHAFIWSDFKDAVKENWKQGLAVSAITGFAPLLAYVCWNFYGQMAQQTPFMIVPQMLVMMIMIVWALAVTYMYPLMVSYKLRFRDLIRNAVLLSIARLPQSVGVRLLHCVPVIIGAVVAMFFSAIWAVLGLFVYYLLLGFGLSRFVTASFTNGVFDKYINSHMEGVQVNRGLNTDPEEDDDEEDAPSDD